MKSISLLACILMIPLAGTAWSADLVLNEYNAVPEIGGFLKIGKTDLRFGRREGNGGDWFGCSSRKSLRSGAFSERKISGSTR